MACKVKRSDLEWGLDLDGLPEAECFVHKETGLVVVGNTDFPVEEQMAAHQGEWIECPRNNELDLGKRLYIDFAKQYLPEQLEHVWQIFKKKGAYRRARYFFEDQGLLEQFYAYEAQRRKEAMQEWACDNGFELIDE